MSNRKRKKKAPKSKLGQWSIRYRDKAGKYLSKKKARRTKKVIFTELFFRSSKMKHAKKWSRFKGFRGKAQLIPIINNPRITRELFDEDEIDFRDIQASSFYELAETLNSRTWRLGRNDYRDLTIKIWYNGKRDPVTVIVPVRGKRDFTVKIGISICKAVGIAYEIIDSDLILEEGEFTLDKAKYAIQF